MIYMHACMNTQQIVLISMNNEIWTTRSFIITGFKINDYDNIYQVTSKVAEKEKGKP